MKIAIIYTLGSAGLIALGMLWIFLNYPGLRLLLRLMKKETNETYKITCPDCNKSYPYPYSPEERDGWTTDCIKCNALLVFEGNKVHNFHKWLHAKTEGDEYQWPIDGHGTGYVDIQ